MFVFDFDGVFTDATQDEMFVAQFRTTLHEALGATIEASVWDRALETVARQPAAHGWRRDARIIASACDVFLAEQAAGRVLAIERGLDEAVAEAALDRAFFAGWRASRLALRDDARSVVAALEHPGRPWYIITNADPKRVRDRLRDESVPFVDERIVGDAHKDRIDVSVSWPGVTFGLERDLFPVRPDYIARLTDVARDAGCAIRDMVVVGDNAELDLLTPFHLGARVVLYQHRMTLDWECRWIDHLDGRGRAIHSLEELLR